MNIENDIGISVFTGLCENNVYMLFREKLFHIIVDNYMYFAMKYEKHNDVAS